MNERSKKSHRILLVLALVPVAILAKPSEPSDLSASFNGDGHADLAIGVPGEDIGTTDDAGSVNVLYGTSPDGLSAQGDQLWHQDSTGMVDVAETSEEFGGALAVGDFDGDGYADLAIGVMFQIVGNAVAAGAVHVLYGAYGGLTASGNQLWTQDSPGIEGAAEGSDLFGWALAVGDFNGDGYADLAVGAPTEDVGVLADAGAVNIIYGSASGLTAAGDQLWHQDSTGVVDVAEDDDWFGSSLAAGDFDGDGYADLAIGVRHEGVSNSGGAGAVNVLYGSAGGLTVSGNQLWTQDSPGIEGAAEESDFFGWALAAGDFNGNGYTDLAVGALGEDVGALPSAGAVNIIYGSASGLTAAGDQLWTQDSSGVQGTAEAVDDFGSSLAAGDFDGDGYADLAVGVRYEDVNSISHAGAVNVLYGSAGGLTASGNQLWTQDSPGIEDAAEEGDSFGRALAAGDFNGDGYADLAIGAPYEDVNSIGDAGAVHILYGAYGGLTASGSQLWTQDSPGIEGVAEDGDSFGRALAALPPERHRVYLPLVVRN